MKFRSGIGYALGILGVVWSLITVAVFVWLDVHETGEPTHLLYVSLGLGAVIGWWGFYWADSKRALTGGEFVVHSGERLRAVPGRRDTDPVTVVKEPILAMDKQDGDLDNPPHLGGSAAPELPNIPATPPPPERIR